MASLSSYLYNRSPYAIQNLAVSAYGLYLRRMRYGRNYNAALNWLRTSAGFTAEQLLDYQNAHVDRLVKLAVANVPYYRAKYGVASHGWGRIGVENLRDHVEVLEKSTVKAAAKEFVSVTVPRTQRVMVSTSGTTGSPLQITASKDAVAINFAFFSDFLYRCGLDPFEWSVTFAGRLVVPTFQTSPPYWRCNRAMRTWLFSSYHISERTACEYVAKLREVKPTYIDSYPSAVYALSRFIVDNQITLGFQIKAVVTSSETLTAEQRSVIERAFGCRVYDQYGCAEMAAFVYQCAMGGYHVHPLYGVLEVLDGRGQPCGPGMEGDLVLTGLINDAMPLIRYRIGDRAIACDTACTCGNLHPTVARIIGREDDYIVTPEGNLVGRLDPLFKGLVGISEAQILQRTLNEIAVLVVPNPQFDAAAAEGLARGLSERVGARMSVNVELVDHIPRSTGGKFRSVVSLVWAERRQQSQSTKIQR